MAKNVIPHHLLDTFLNSKTDDLLALYICLRYILENRGVDLDRANHKN